MKTAKFLIAATLMLCILLSASFSVVAESNWSAKLNLVQTDSASDGNTVSVRISVSDITSKTGIVCAIFHVNYDPSALELVSWKNAYPSGWDFSGNSSFGAEDWTSVLEDDNGNSYLMYTVMNTTLEQGVTEDNVLYTDLVFEVISDTVRSTELRVTEISFMDKEIENDCVLPDQTLKIDLGSDESSAAESSDEPSVAESSEETSQTSSVESEEESLPSESEVGNEETSAEESTDTSEDESLDESKATSSEETDDTSVSELSESSAVSDISSESSLTSETSEKLVTMTVLLDDIKDEYGVSALQFKLTYKPSMLEFVDYEILLPDNWDLSTEYTEDLCSVGTNGALMFCVMNYQVGCGVKSDNTLGFRITFKVKNVEFDPSLITMSDILLINDNLEDVAEEDYRFSITYTDENGELSEDTFSSTQDEGKTVKIVIAVVSCVVVLAIAICAVVIIRKKKKA